MAKFLKLVAEVVSSHDSNAGGHRFESRHFYFYFLFILPKIPLAERVQTTYFGLTIIRGVVGIFIFAGIFQKVAEMSLKKVVDRGLLFYIFHFYCIFIKKYFQLFQKVA